MFTVKLHLNTLTKAVFSVTQYLHRYKSSNVARRLYVQPNVRLIGIELFSISTGGGAVKKSYISMEDNFLPETFATIKTGCITKNSGGSIYVQEIHFLTLILRGTHLKARSQECLCVFSTLFSFPDRCSDYTVLYMHRTFPFQWHKLIYAACPPAKDLIQYKGTCIYFTSCCRGQIYGDI